MTDISEKNKETYRDMVVQSKCPKKRNVLNEWCKRVPTKYVVIGVIISVIGETHTMGNTYLETCTYRERHTTH